jgi:phosphoribosylglycinamide formyltransferase-1
MKKRIAVLISGSGSNLQAIIDAISAKNINAEIVLVISNKADAFGLTRAKNANIQTKVLQHTQYESRLTFDQDLLASIDEFNVDLVVLAGFMRILTPEFVNHFCGRMLNIHPSLLPKYKGLDTHQRALTANDKEHGCSVHFVTPELDGGPVALQAVVKISPLETLSSLEQKVHEAEHIAYSQVVAWFCQEKLKCIDNNLYLDNELLAPSGFRLDISTN